MKDSHAPKGLLAENRRARFDYELIDSLEGGIELTGQEVKSVKAGHMGLNGSYVLIRDGEASLLNAQIPPYQVNNTPEDYKPTRTRRLLLHKQQIEHLAGQLHQKGLALLPMRVYLKGPRIKLELALGRSRKKEDKRAFIKERDARREMRDAS